MDFIDYDNILEYLASLKKEVTDSKGGLISSQKGRELLKVTRETFNEAKLRKEIDELTAKVAELEEEKNALTRQIASVTKRETDERIKKDNLKRLNEELKVKIAKLESANEENNIVKESEPVQQLSVWQQYVTYENVVNYIADVEDTQMREAMKGLMRGILPKSEHSAFSRALKTKIAENNLSEEGNQKIYNIKGDFVMNKHVDNEVGTVETGATGIINKQNPEENE